MSTNQKVIGALFAQLEEEKYYGTVELTLASGQLKFIRKIGSMQDYEIVVASWARLSAETRIEMRGKFGKNEKFLTLLREGGHA